MRNCLLIRVNDQYQCSCGLQWDIDEENPHVMVIGIDMAAPGADKTVHRNIGNKALIAIKENLNRE